MSKKNSNAILKNRFKDSKDLYQIYLDFKKKINKYKSKPFLVAVSGGPDSLALVALTKAYSYENNSKFYYVLIDHNIRKKSNFEAKQVKNLLKKNSIYIDIIVNKVKIKKNIQSEARKIRYKLLENYCKKNKINTLLTAHNLEDQVETFFIRLSRGSGLTGLSSMSPVNKLNNKVVLLRPLLNVKKKFLMKCSKIAFGKYFIDPSNKNKKYLRTRIRNLQKPLQDSGLNYEQIIKSINNLASSKKTLDNLIKKILKDLIVKTGNNISINLQNFNNLNEETKIRAINESIRKLKKNYYNPRSEKVVYLLKAIKSKKFISSTLGGCIFMRKNGKLCIKIEKN